MKKYNILWFDDDHEDHLEFKLMAERQNISIIGFKSADGLSFLEKNLNFVDGIILDAMFDIYEDHSNPIPSLEAFIKVRNRLIQLEGRKKLPLFILSGQTRFEQDTTFKESFGEHYRKSNYADINRLFDDIKANVDQMPDNLLKQKYSNVLFLCSDHYIGLDNFDRIFTLAKHLESHESVQLAENMLNPIRKIIEALFMRLHNLNLIPDEIMQSNGWINGSSLFLNEKHKSYFHTEPFFPKLLAENLRHILAITQDGSHAYGNLNLNVEKYIRTVPNDFLYRSIVFLLFDLLVSFKSFFDDHKDPEKNKLLWSNNLTKNEDENVLIENLNWITGTLIRINSNKYGTLAIDNSGETLGILPKVMFDNELQIGDRLKVTTIPNHDGTKKHIDRLEKI